MSESMPTHDDLVPWLRNKYNRHGEIEDKLAADRIEELEAALQRIVAQRDVDYGESPSYDHGIAVCAEIASAALDGRTDD